MVTGISACSSARSSVAVPKCPFVAICVTVTHGVAIRGSMSVSVRGLASSLGRARFVVHRGTDLLSGIIVHMNKEWHQRHRMPVKATLDQRVQWHMEHAAVCDCRPVPPRVAAVIKRRQKPPR